MRLNTAIICTALFGLALSGCSPKSDQPTPSAAKPEPAIAVLYADTLYKNGVILTMDGDAPSYVEALSVRNGKIQTLGSLASVQKFQGENTRVVDLAGKTMLPGFIDPHGHFMFALNMVNQVNVAAPPVGSVTRIADVTNLLKAYQQDNNIPEGGWVVGWGYDQDTLAEGRHMTKADLDAVLPKHKVLIIHVSGHGGILNSEALAWAKVDETTVTPAGGIIARMEGSEEPAGLLMETAYLSVFENLPQPSEGELLKLMKPAQMLYAQEGYTHAQEGFTHLKDMDFLLKAAEQGTIFLDLVSLPGFVDAPKWMKDEKYVFGEYHKGLKFQGIKFTQDGSPQGKTAYVTTPYLTGGPSGEKDWHGETTQPPEDFKAQVKLALEAGLQVFIHANGDATIDEVIEAVEELGVKAEDDRRLVIIHSQFQRPDHLPKYKALGLTPSYFTNHTFFWGDVHMRNLGEEKANFISPVKAATDMGLIYSNHTDFNITPLDPFFVMWSAMARTSRSGQVIGEDQRVDAYTALQGITTGPAYQLFEEDRKGRLKAGLLADFVILDKNPLKTTVENFRDIEVLQTIKEDKVIYGQ